VNLNAQQGKVHATLLGMDGRTLHTWNGMNGHSFRLNLPAQVASGMYFLRISDANQSNSIRINIER
jgi:hypothetical protein